MKTFIAEYSERWAYGGYEEKVYYVVANTREEALGLVLEAYPKLKTSCWYVTEPDLTELKVEELMHRES